MLSGEASASDIGRTTGLPIPRFVSTKTQPANVRVGPGLDYPVKWTFVRRGLPVEVIAEFDNWRRIRDWEGKDGWMFGQLLSGKRTALVAPWPRSRPVLLRADGTNKAAAVAIVEPTVFVRVIGCDGQWCKVAAKREHGYLPQTSIWGAYPGEVF